MITKRSSDAPRTAQAYRLQAYSYLYYPQHAHLRSLAIPFYAQAIKLEPENAALHVELGRAYLRFGQREEADRCFAHALALQPDSLQTQLQICLGSFPPIFRDVAEAERMRTHFQETFLSLVARIGAAKPAMQAEIARTIGNFLHAPLILQGAVDHTLQMHYGRLACELLAHRYPTFTQAPEVAPPAPNEAIRVGFAFPYFRNHSAWQVVVKGWVMNLEPVRFQLYGYALQQGDDGETEIARSHLHRLRHGEMKVREWAETIRRDRLHLLIYPETGLQGTVEKLAGLRLAPVQCSAGGIYFTSGLPTIDYYLGSELIEPPDGDEHYCERLVRLPNLSFFYIPPDITPVAKRRAEWGLRDSAVVYLCSQALAKYHPRYDDLYARIAAEVEDCQFVFFERREPAPNYRLFQQRLAAPFTARGLDAAKHLVFQRSLSPQEYQSVQDHSDIFLDSIDVGGVATTLLALSSALPIVTLRGRYQRGRTASAILTMMRMPETIADDVDEYVAVAVSLGQNSAWRAQVAAGMAQNRHKVYRDQQAIEGLESFLDQSVRGEQVV